MIPFIVLVTVICIFGMGWACGQYAERMAWNQLIKEGKIPDPKGK